MRLKTSGRIGSARNIRMYEGRKPASQRGKRPQPPKRRPAAQAPKAKLEASTQPEPELPSISKLMLQKSNDGWALMVDDLSEPAWTLGTKKKALAAARREANALEAPLEIYATNGKLQDTYEPTA